MSKFNRIANSKNEFQGEYKKVLCVCSAGLLRSPTAAVVLSQPPFNFNTRAAGMFSEFALVCVDDVLVHWADEIVCMESEHKDRLEQWMEAKQVQKRPVVCLEIEDSFAYRDEKLQWLIKEKYESLQQGMENEGPTSA